MPVNNWILLDFNLSRYSTSFDELFTKFVNPWEYLNSKNRYGFPIWNWTPTPKLTFTENGSIESIISVSVLDGFSCVVAASVMLSDKPAITYAMLLPAVTLTLIGISNSQLKNLDYHKAHTDNQHRIEVQYSS